MFYYISFTEDESYNPVVIDGVYIKGKPEYSYELVKAESFTWDKSNYLTYSDGDVLEDYVPNTIPAPLISSKLKEIIECYTKKGDVEFFEVALKSIAQPSKVDNYYVMNVLTCIDALDTRRSLFGIMIGNKKTIMKYAIDKNIVKEAHIFRLKGYERSKLFVSDELKKAIYAANVTGLDFGETIS